MELTFQTEKISPRVTRIFAFNTELMYLIEGDERAALLDTGSGFGSLRSCVDALTDKPVVVLLTHGHTDHALGAAEFETVCMNPLDEAVYARHSDMAFRAGSGAMWPDFAKLRAEQIVPAMAFADMRSLKAGEAYELGGETVECFACPGHTPGSLVFLLRQARMLLLGDACNDMTFLFDDHALSVSDYRRSLLRLDAATRGKYDRVLLSHGDGEGTPDMIARVLGVCDDVLAGRSDEQPFTFMGDTGILAKAVDGNGRRRDGGRGNLVYKSPFPDSQSS
ncbi:MAG: MBL fold metallo-hydrolase [Oscillospiraceae bacterium]